jgi:hypothetical protein
MICVSISINFFSSKYYCQQKINIEITEINHFGISLFIDESVRIEYFFHHSVHINQFGYAR